MVIQNPDLWLFLKIYRRPGIWDGWLLQQLQLVVYWPVAYVIVSSIQKRWRSRVIEA